MGNDETSVGLNPPKFISSSSAGTFELDPWMPTPVFVEEDNSLEEMFTFNNVLYVIYHVA